MNDGKWGTVSSLISDVNECEVNVGHSVQISNKQLKIDVWNFWVRSVSKIQTQISDWHKWSLVAHSVKNLPAVQKTWVWSLGQEDPWRKEWQPTPVFLPEFHGQRGLAGYSPWGCKVRHEWSYLGSTHSSYQILLILNLSIRKFSAKPQVPHKIKLPKG